MELFQVSHPEGKQTIYAKHRLSSHGGQMKISEVRVGFVMGQKTGSHGAYPEEISEPEMIQGVIMSQEALSLKTNVKIGRLKGKQTSPTAALWGWTAVLTAKC